MKNKEKPIQCALDAVRYALDTSISPVDWPRIIHVDENQVPLQRNEGGGTGFIYVARRSGDVSPTDEDIKYAEAMRDAADQMDQKFIDFIILGTGCFYSFAQERTVHFMRAPGGLLLPVPRGIIN